jgi:hypothetical protein
VAVSSRDDLFGVDPAEFVAARDALAKELRSGGDTSGAADVKKLRRPAVPVWALNQVARSQSRAVEAFLDAAVAARRAQSDVLAGADATVLRDAMTTRRRMVDTVAAEARSVIEESGRSGATYERDVDTMLAALAASDVYDDDFRRGALTDVSPTEADEDVFAQLAASTPVARPGKPERKEESAPLRKARERLARDREAAAEATRDLNDAQKRLAAAQRAAEEAARHADRAHEAMQRSAEAVERLEG